jgi:hypothetical protein
MIGLPLMTGGNNRGVSGVDVLRPGHRSFAAAQDDNAAQDDHVGRESCQQYAVITEREKMDAQLRMSGMTTTDF